MELREKPITSVFNNNSGQNVFYRNWKMNGVPKGIVLIVHGLNSHSGYYQHFAVQLKENSFDVFAMDLRGRGQSEGERYYINDYNDIVADIDQLLSIARITQPTLPVFLFGHSAGGVFASVYALLYQHKLKGLIAESFAFQVPAPSWALAMIKFVSRFIPHTRIVKLKNEDFSRDKSVVETMDDDILLANERQPARTMQQLLLASDFLKKGMYQIRIPLLILHGTGDRATKPAGSKYFLEHVSSTDKQLKLYEGHYHDLLNDKYNGIVIRDILRWLKERV